MQSFAKPVAGAPMPELCYQTLQRGRIRFEQLPGWRMLVVYRGRHCPLCERYLQSLDELCKPYAALGVDVHALSADPVERAGSQAEQQGWSFTVGVDLDVEQMRRLGLYISTPRSPQETDRPFAEPALFVVNADSRMQIIDISNAPFARPSLADVLEGIRTIQQHDYPVRGTG